MPLHKVRQQKERERNGKINQRSAHSMRESESSTMMVGADCSMPYRQRIALPQCRAPRGAEKHGKAAERRPACRLVTERDEQCGDFRRATRTIEDRQLL